MAFSEFEQFRIEKAIDGFMKQRRPRPDIRHEFDLSAKIERHSLVLYEVRPDWQDKTEIHISRFKQYSIEVGEIRSEYF